MKLLIWNTIIILINVILAQECVQPRIRKEIRELSELELNNYVRAVNILHSTHKDGSLLSENEKYSKLHDLSNKYIHRDPTFLSWHREFLFQYESRLRLIDSSITLPYWDWSLDYEFPHESIVLSKFIMGGNGDSNNDNCLSTGKFNNLTLNYPTDEDPHCLRRTYNDDRNVTSFMPPEIFLSLFNENRFSYFSFLMEIYHGYPHMGIGGDYGDFSTMYSPSDPLFYLHHAFIDLLFSKWQLQNPNSLYDGVRYNKEANPSATLLYFKINTEQAWNTKNARYCYDYPEYPRVIVNPDYTNQEVNGNSLPKEKEKDDENNNILNKVLNPALKGKNQNNKALKNLSPKKQQLITNLMASNPLFNQESDTTNKTIVELTKYLNGKHGKDKKAKKLIRKGKKVSKKWADANRFTDQEVEEAHKIASDLVDALNSVQDFVSIADANKLVEKDI